MCTPYDDVQTAVLKFLDTAKQQVLVAGYSITNPVIVEKLIELKTKGLDVEVITDTQQAAGASERQAISTMQAYGVQVFIGKSKYHQLMHCKFIVIDDTASEDGSYNYTKSANYQDNVAHFNDDPELAKQLHSFWNQIKADLQ